MQKTNPASLAGADGPIGEVVELAEGEPGQRGTLGVLTSDGRNLEIPASVVEKRQDGSYYVPMTAEELDRFAADTNTSRDEIVIPVIAEELQVGKRQVSTGGIRVHKTVQAHEEVVVMPLQKDHVDVRRVVVNRDVDGPLPIRYEGETTIIPVVEEVIVVEKRMRLKEEIHITRRTTTEVSEQRVTLQREEAVIERLDAEGGAQPEDVPIERESRQEQPVQEAAPKARRVRRNRIITEG